MATGREDRPIDYEEVWPEVAARLEVALRRRGLSRSGRDDVIQETAARLWERWSTVDQSSDVFPLAFTIARNLASDRARERRRIELHPVIEARVGDDPVEIASGRLELRRVFRALALLTPRYRDLLLAEAGWPVDAPVSAGRTATNMARMRARRRLHALLEQASAVIAIRLRNLRIRWPRSGASLRLQLGQPWAACSIEIVAACILTLASGHALGSVLVEDPLSSSVTLASATRDGVARDPERNSTHVRVREDVPAPRPPIAKVSRDEAAPSDASADAMPTLPLRDAARGHGGSGGSFGPEGIDEAGAGNASTAGQEVSWRYAHEYRTPKCVRRAAKGSPSTDCSGGHGPRGYLEVEHGGREARFDYEID